MNLSKPKPSEVTDKYWLYAVSVLIPHRVKLIAFITLVMRHLIDVDTIGYGGIRPYGTDESAILGRY